MRRTVIGSGAFLFIRGKQMKKRYFTELARRLKGDGVSVGEAGESHLPIQLHGQAAMNVTWEGTVILMPNASGDQEAGELYDKVSRLASAVKEYTSAMEWAPLLEAAGLDKAEGYRLLADFNGVVLAGQKLEKGRGYQFATWVRSPDRTGVAHGDYHWNDFAGAKLSFASRSGLVQTDHQFTDEQLAEVYRCVWEVMDSDGYKLTEDRRAKLQEIAKQIERGVPDLEELVSQSNELELELNL